MIRQCVVKAFYSIEPFILRPPPQSFIHSEHMHCVPAVVDFDLIVVSSTTKKQKHKGCSEKRKRWMTKIQTFTFCVTGWELEGRCDFSPECTRKEKKKEKEKARQQRWIQVSRCVCVCVCVFVCLCGAVSPMTWTAAEEWTHPRWLQAVQVYSPASSSLTLWILSVRFESCSWTPAWRVIGDTHKFNNISQIPLTPLEFKLNKSFTILSPVRRPACPRSLSDWTRSISCHSGPYWPPLFSPPTPSSPSDVKKRDALRELMRLVHQPAGFYVCVSVCGCFLVAGPVWFNSLRVWASRWVVCWLLIAGLYCICHDWNGGAKETINKCLKSSWVNMSQSFLFLLFFFNQMWSPHNLTGRVLLN